MHASCMRLVIPHFIDPYYTYIVCKYPTNLFVQSNVLFESENSAWVQFQLELDLLRFGYVSHNKTHKDTCRDPNPSQTRLGNNGMEFKIASTFPVLPPWCFHFVVLVIGANKNSNLNGFLKKRKKQREPFLFFNQFTNSTCNA